jgi:alkylated DNA repair dioxygenase AlkB
MSRQDTARQERQQHVGGAALACVEVLVTEYVPGAGIGWHRDAPMFGIEIGVSLLGGCRPRTLRSGAARTPAPLSGT